MRLTKISEKKAGLARKLFWNSVVSMVLVVLAVELRLNQSDGIDEVKTLSFINAACGIFLNSGYYVLHRDMLFLSRTKSSIVESIMPAFEFIILIVGIMPPVSHCPSTVVRTTRPRCV
eukprot:3639280-Prymnesium_polylepis.1